MDELPPVEGALEGERTPDERRAWTLVGVGATFGVIGLALAVAGLCFSAALMWPLAGVAGLIAMLLGASAVWRARKIQSAPEERRAYTVALAGGLVDLTLGLVLVGVGGLGMLLLVVVIMESAAMP